jgi:hypothetical protein
VTTCGNYAIKVEEAGIPEAVELGYLEVDRLRMCSGVHAI